MDIRKIELMKSLQREYYGELRRRKSLEYVRIPKQVWFMAKMSMTINAALIIGFFLSVLGLL